MRFNVLRYLFSILIILRIPPSFYSFPTRKMAEPNTIMPQHPEVTKMLKEVAPIVQMALRKRAAALTDERKRLDTDWVRQKINTAIGILVSWDIAIKDELRKPSIDPAAIFNSIFAPRSPTFPRPTAGIAPPKESTSPPPPPPSATDATTTSNAVTPSVIKTLSIPDPMTIAEKTEAARAKALRAAVFGKYGKPLSTLFSNDFVNENFRNDFNTWKEETAKEVESMKGFDWAEESMGHERISWEMPHAPNCPKAIGNTPSTSKDAEMPELVDEQKPEGEGWPTPDPSDSEETASRSAIAAAMLPFYPRLTVDFRELNAEPTTSKKSRKKKKKH